MCGRGLDIVSCYRDLVPRRDRLGGGEGEVLNEVLYVEALLRG